MEKMSYLTVIFVRDAPFFAAWVVGRGQVEMLER